MNELIKVLTLTPGTDDNGFSRPTETETDLFCEVKSSSYIDRYAANSDNTIAQIVFVMRREDFDSTRITENKKHYYPNAVEYEGARYKLIRWRYVDKGKAEMICG